MEQFNDQPADFELLEVEGDTIEVAEIAVSAFFGHSSKLLVDPGLRLIISEDRPPVDLTHFNTELCIVKDPAFRCFVRRWEGEERPLLLGIDEELIDMLLEMEFPMMKLKRPQGLALDIYCKLEVEGLMKALED